MFFGWIKPSKQPEEEVDDQPIIEQELSQQKPANSQPVLQVSNQRRKLATDIASHYNSMK